MNSIIKKRFGKLMSLLLSLFIITTMLPTSAYGGILSSESGKEFLIKTGEFSISITDSSGNAVSMLSGIDGEYNVNSIPYQKGTYYYAAHAKDGTDIGKGKFDVDGSHPEIVLRQIVFSKNEIEDNGIGYSIEVKNSSDEFSYSPGAAGNSFVLPALEGRDYYKYNFLSDATETYWGSSGIMYVYASAKADTFQALNLSDSGKFLVAKKKQIKIQTPEGAELKIYHRVKFYRPLEKIECGAGTTENGITTYICEVPDNTKLHYEVRQQDKITKASTFNTMHYDAGANPLVISGLKDRTNADEIRDESQSFYEANLYMNLPDSRYLQLKEGESFDITTFRSWQAVETGTGNYYVEPDYHYEVMEYNGSSASVTVDDSGRIKATSPGISVVKVTYDPLDYLAVKKELVYSGIWRENTGIIVVDVDSDSKDTFKTGIGLSEYDTVYYIKSENGKDKDSYAEYTFSPKTDGNVAVRVQKPLATDWSAEWIDGTMNADATWTVKLQEGPNIVEVKSGDKAQYHVVYAKGLDLTISNLTHPDKAIVSGDKVRITFDGLKMPVPKLAAIYNPGYPNETWVEYDFGDSTVKSEGVQYTVTKDNAIEFYADEAGTTVLSNGRIHTTSIGENESAHRKINKASMNSSYIGGDSAENINGYYSVLPDIEVRVTDAEENEEYERQNYSNLTELKFGMNFNADRGKGYTLYEGIVPQAFFMVYEKSGFFIEAKPIHSDCTVKVYADDKEEILEAKKKFSGEISTIKIVVTPNNPEKGYPKTYTINCIPTNEGTNTGAYGHYEVKVKADEEDLTDRLALSDNSEKEIYGAGFLSCFDSYDITVPYNIQNMNLSVMASITGGTITNAKKYSGKLTTIITLGGLVEKSEKVYTGSVTSTQNIALSGNNDTAIDFSIKHISYNKKDEQQGERLSNYKLNIKQEAAPNEVKFDNLQNEASVIIKNSKGNVINPKSDGTYELSNGTYKYYVTKEGYETIVRTHAVTSDESTHLIRLPDMVKIPKQSGEVTVSVTSADSYIKVPTALTIREPEDLAKLKYVEYNHGGYTALHAIIDAMQNGVSKKSFSCRKGILTPKNVVKLSDKGQNAGWVCEINGKVCSDPANTLVNGGDIVEYYYNADYEGMQHAAFEENVKQTLTAGSPLNLTLLSKDVGTDGEKTACAGADILLNGKSINIITDEKGKVAIPAEKISEPGQYTISAVKKNGSGQNILTYTACILTVKKTDTQQPTGKTTVTFRLIGDAVHSAGSSNHSKYVTWIATRSYTFNKESVSVYELFTKALRDAGLSYIGAENNYVSAIQAPKGYGGYWLREFTNGKNSGWMYTVNGEHPLFGLKDYYVTNGDSIVWHYVDDYQLETSFEGSVPAYPNRWLEAEDTDPPTDKVIDMSGKGEAKDVTTSGASGSATTTSPTEVKVSGSTAAATVKAENQSEILKQATEKKSAEIILEVSKADSKGADSVQLSLDVKFVKNVADKTNADLTVNTENGKVTLDQETLKTIIGEAKGNTVIIEITKVTKPTEAQKKAAGANGHLLKLTIKSGDKVISDFNKGKVKVVAEIVSKLLDKKVAAIHIADDGKIEQLAGKVLTIGGKKYYEFTTPHFSTFALVDADELGLEVEEPQVDAKALTAKLTLVARSAKTAKKNIKVTVSLDKQDKAIIKELKDAGYTVKYRFYRSTKKAAGYKAAVTKKTASYTNTGGKKGTKYFYKVQIRVYDENGKLTAKTALKQCKYASRTWTK